MLKCLTVFGLHFKNDWFDNRLLKTRTSHIIFNGFYKVIFSFHTAKNPSSLKFFGWLETKQNIFFIDPNLKTFETYLTFKTCRNVENSEWCGKSCINQSFFSASNSANFFLPPQERFKYRYFEQFFWRLVFAIFVKKALKFDSVCLSSMISKWKLVSSWLDFSSSWWLPFFSDSNWYRYDLFIKKFLPE